MQDDCCCCKSRLLAQELHSLSRIQTTLFASIPVLVWSCPEASHSHFTLLQALTTGHPLCPASDTSTLHHCLGEELWDTESARIGSTSDRQRVSELLKSMTFESGLDCSSTHLPFTVRRLFSSLLLFSFPRHLIPSATCVYVYVSTSLPSSRLRVHSLPGRDPGSRLRPARHVVGVCCVRLDPRRWMPTDQRSSSTSTSHQSRQLSLVGHSRSLH